MTDFKKVKNITTAISMKRIVSEMITAEDKSIIETCGHAMYVGEKK